MSATGLLRRFYSAVTDRKTGSAATDEWRAEDCCPCECTRPRTGLVDPSVRPRIYVR